MKKMMMALAGFAAMAVAAPAAAQNADFVNQLRQALQSNPELVVEAMQRAQQRQQAQQAQLLEQRVGESRSMLASRNTPGIVLGNPSGKTTLVEFLDYRCGYCQMMHDRVEQLMTENKDARVVIMMRPVLGPQSDVLARYALAANVQGKFKAAHDELYTNKYEGDDASLQRLSNKIGVNWAKAKLDMTGPKVSDKLAEHNNIANKLQIQGTPFFITPTKVLPGAVDKDQLLAK